MKCGSIVSIKRIYIKILNLNILLVILCKILFCCTKHEPINCELIENGCFICMEKIEKSTEKSTEILYFKCHHAVHKPCYIDWLEFSTYEEPICMMKIL